MGFTSSGETDPLQGLKEKSELSGMWLMIVKNSHRFRKEIVLVANKTMDNSKEVKGEANEKECRERRERQNKKS